MKEQYKQKALYIAYYQQRVSKNQLLATFVEPLVLSRAHCQQRVSNAETLCSKYQ